MTRERRMKFTIETTEIETVEHLHEAVVGAARRAPCTLRIEWEGAPVQKVVLAGKPGLTFLVEEGTTEEVLRDRVKAKLAAHKVK